jgi:3-oxoadipate enol-lactonase
MFATVNHVKLHYEIDGDGPWLTLSHSVGTNNSMWAPQVDSLSRHFKVLRVETRGHGQSECPAGPYQMSDLANDVVALWDELGIQQSHWLGLSMGGMIGQTLALMSPERLSHLILANTTGRGPVNAATLWADRAATAQSKGMKAMVEGSLSRWFTEPFRTAHPEVMASVAAMIEGSAAEGYAACCLAIGAVNTLEALRQVRIPTLILVGDSDQATPPAMAQMLHEHLADSQLCVLPNAAHLSNMEQPELFTEAVLRFLKPAT